MSSIAAQMSNTKPEHLPCCDSSQGSRSWTGFISNLWWCYCIAWSTYKFERQRGVQGVMICCSFVPSFVRVTAVLAVKRAERHDHARTTAHDHARPTPHDHALPRMTDHARTTAHDRPRTTDRARPRTTTHDRPRTTAHDRPRLPYLFEEAVPTPPQGGLGG